MEHGDLPMRGETRWAVPVLQDMAAAGLRPIRTGPVLSMNGAMPLKPGPATGCISAFAVMPAVGPFRRRGAGPVKPIVTRTPRGLTAHGARRTGDCSPCEPDRQKRREIATG